MRVAVIGLGAWGAGLLRCFHAKHEVVWSCSLGDVSRLQWLRTRYPTIPHTTSFDLVLADDRIDAVVLATPSRTHEELALKALAAGKHVFVEKPPASNADGVAELMRAAHVADRVLFVGYVFLHHPIWALMKSAVRNEGCEGLTCQWLKREPSRSRPRLVSHQLSLCVDLLGEPMDLPASREDGRRPAVESMIDENSLAVTRLGYSIPVWLTTTRASLVETRCVTVQTSNRLLVWQDERLEEFHDGLWRTLYDRASATPVALDAERDCFAAAVDEHWPPSFVPLGVARIFDRLRAGNQT